MLARLVKAFANISVGFLLFSGVLTGIFSIFGYFGQSQWEFDLLSHFRIQYSIWLAFLSLLFLPSRLRIWSLIFLCFIGVNLCEILPYYLTGPQTVSRPVGNLRLMQMNLWSHNEDYPRIIKAIKDAEPDIISFNELTPRSAETLAREFEGYPFRVFQPQDDCFGIGIMSRVYLENTDIIQVVDRDKQLVSPPVVTAKFNWQGKEVSIISTHLLPPLSDNSVQINRLLVNQLAEICKVSKPVILIGDLNLTRHSVLFKKLKADGGLLDTEDGRGWQPSYPAVLPLVWIPIDHCLLSPEFTIVTRRTAEWCGSDHFPMLVDIR